MNVCRQCKYFGSCKNTGKTACYLNPPITTMIPMKGSLGNTEPAILSYRPAVEEGDYACKDFHEIFHSPDGHKDVFAPE